MGSSPWRSRFWSVGVEETFDANQKRAELQAGLSILSQLGSSWAWCASVLCFTAEPWHNLPSSSKQAALMGRQARWQGLVERHAAAFKGLSLAWEQEGWKHITAAGWEPNPDGKPAHASEQTLTPLVHIKHPFSALLSIPDGYTCFSLFLCSGQKNIVEVLQVLLQHWAGVAALGGSQGRGRGLRHFPIGFLKWRNNTDMLGVSILTAFSLAPSLLLTGDGMWFHQANHPSCSTGVTQVEGVFTNFQRSYHIILKYPSVQSFAFQPDVFSADHVAQWHLVAGWSQLQTQKSPEGTWSAMPH